MAVSICRVRSLFLPPLFHFTWHVNSDGHLEFNEPASEARAQWGPKNSELNTATPWLTQFLVNMTFSKNQRIALTNELMYSIQNFLGMSTPMVT